MALPTIHEDIAYDEQVVYIPILSERKSEKYSTQGACVRSLLTIAITILLLIIIYQIPYLATNEIIFISIVIGIVALIVVMIGVYVISPARPNEQIVIARAEFVA